MYFCFWLFLYKSKCIDELKEFDPKVLSEQISAGKKVTELIDFETIKSKYPAVIPIASLIETIDVSKSDCYSDAVSEMKVNCHTIEQKQNEQLRKNLSLRFTQCFYKISNRLDEFPDDLDTSKMSQSTYSVYLTFDHHITNLCYFAHGEAFNARTSEQLLTLFKKTVESAAVIENLTREFNESSESLEKAIENISVTLQEGKESIDMINTKMISFQNNIGDVSYLMHILVNHIDRLKIYIVVLISAFITAYYLPEILIPVTLMTIVLFFIDKTLAFKYLWWDDSLIRKLFRAVYLSTCAAYPIYMIVSYIIYVLQYLKSKISVKPKKRLIGSLGIHTSKAPKPLF